MFSIITSMAIFAFIGAVSPGPVNIMATSSSVNFGFKRTLPHVFGASMSYAAIVLLVGLGLSQLLSQNPQITDALKYIGAAFLLYMSYKIATAAADDSEAIENKRAPTVLEGGLAQGLNPKAWLVSMSGVSIFVTPNDPSSLYVVIFSLLSFIICLLGVGTWAVAGSIISEMLSEKRHQVTFNRIMGVLLSLTVVSIFL
ncbi:threonine transporter RhtB ['Osedax' symbiont bacterium Rs2_46_30_T18]|nr:threonine transporter RhtB ['Osedax' symbiont bacterium Rs2_46_30_T18]